MPSRRYPGIAVCLCSASMLMAPPVAAQSAATQRADARQATTPDIIVDGTIDAPSAWKRAESAHVIVTSKGSEAELKRVTTNLERLYYVMSRVLRRADKPDDTVKLQVTLIDSADFFQSMDLRNLRSEEGPYAGTFSGQRYYDPREDGEVLAVARTDQTIKLATALAEDRDAADAAEAGADASLGATANRSPIARPWEAVLYSAFAQHYLLTYLPGAYPRWYLDGIGALFSTMNVRRDGKIDYARAPLDYRQVFRSYGDLSVRDVLTGQYLDAAPGKRRWTPYHAWLLTHFFLFSNLTPERSRQFERYMAAIQQGAPMAEAAKAFGDLRRLQNQILAYADKSTEFARADPPPTLGGDPLISTLTRSSAALIEAQIELGTRLAPLPADAAAPQRRAAWLADIRNTVAKLPYNADATLTEAEAECRTEHYAECRAAAERVLARSPDTVRALAWQGIAMTHQALAAPVADRAAALVVARKTIEHAIQLDGEAPLPRIAYFKSFTDAGERVPHDAMLGMARVARAVPAAPGPRLYLGEELVRQGEADAARRILYPVLYGAYDSPEKTAATALFAAGGGTASAGR